MAAAATGRDGDVDRECRCHPLGLEARARTQTYTLKTRDSKNGSKIILGKITLPGLKSCIFVYSVLLQSSTKTRVGADRCPVFDFLVPTHSQGDRTGGSARGGKALGEVLLHFCT